jgi:putative sterol carrier protein
MRGKLKLKGNMALAMKLGKVIEAARPDDAKL